MSGFRELGEHLAHAWLNEVDPWSKDLIDTELRFRGQPVFDIQVRFPEYMTVRVYRYIPFNSQYSKLAFVPESTVYER